MSDVSSQVITFEEIDKEFKGLLDKVEDRQERQLALMKRMADALESVEMKLCNISDNIKNKA